MRVRALAAVAAVCLGLSLSGCISLFPKQTPAQLYSFGPAGVGAPVADGGRTVNILRGATTFAAGAGGDRILTRNGVSMAFIGGSRWVSPAALLFDQAETAAFDQGSGNVRLVHPGEMAGASAVLRLEVQTFEAQYPGRLTAAPKVVVQVRAVYTGMGANHALAIRTFSSSQQTQDNRVGEIVQGFDTATDDVLGQVAAWTNGLVAQGPVAG